jgi:hypothetical protein
LTWGVEVSITSTPSFSCAIEIEIQILFFLKSRKHFIMKICIISLLFVVRHLLRLPLIASFLVFFSFFSASIVFPSDLNLVQTPSTGYQPQFQVSGNKAYSVWNEYAGSYWQIFTAEMNTDGRGWNVEKRTAGQFDKVFPQLQVVGNKICYLWHEDHGPTEPIWMAVETLR